MSDRVAPTITLPGIDHGLLAHVGGDRRLLADVIDLFLVDGPMLIEAIRTGLAGGNSGAVRMAAHSLSGSAANFDAADVTRLARELEAYAVGGDVTAAQNAFAPLVDTVSQLLDRLRTIRTALPCAS